MTDGSPSPDPEHRPVTIFVNAEAVRLPRDHATGREIKAAARLPEDLQLRGPDGEDIAEDKQVRLHEGEHFTTAPEEVLILVNNRDVEVPGHEVTGAEIKHAAGVPDDFKLYGPNGSEIDDDRTVRVRRDERFTAISGQDVS